MTKVIINEESYSISNPTDIIKSFILTDPSYEKYDCGEDDECDWWVEEYIHLANSGMRSRISWEKIGKQLNRDEIEKRTGKIPSDTSLEDCSREDIGHLRDLFSYFLDIEGLAKSTTTKILHKRFPKLIPVVDSLVERLYFGNNKRGIKRLMKVILKIREDISNSENKKLFKGIREELSPAIKNSISNVRIFDILLWMKAREDKLKDPEGKNILEGDLLFKKA